MKFIPERLKSARLMNGFSLQDLADKIKVSKQAINRWEMAEAIPTEENLRALEKALGKPYYWFCIEPTVKIVLTDIHWTKLPKWA